MGETIPHDLAWCSSHYDAVYGVLTAYLDSGLRHLPPGAEGVLGRAQMHFYRTGEVAAAARIDTISVVLFRLRQALWTRSESERHSSVRQIEQFARDWLLAAPMFPEDAPLELVA